DVPRGGLHAVPGDEARGDRAEDSVAATPADAPFAQPANGLSFPRDRLFNRMPARHARRPPGGRRMVIPAEDVTTDRAPRVGAPPQVAPTATDVVGGEGKTDVAAPAPWPRFLSKAEDREIRDRLCAELSALFTKHQGTLNDYHVLILLQP